MMISEFECRSKVPGILEVRIGTQKGNVYMKGKHRKAGSERYNKQDLDNRWDPGLEVYNI